MLRAGLRAGVQAVLEDNPAHVRWRTISDPHLAANAPGLATEVGVVVPQSWEEMHRWRPALQRGFAGRRWLLLAQPRIAGLFTWLLDPKRCTILDTAATPGELSDAFQALIDGVVRFPRTDLLARFNHAAASLTRASAPLAVNDRELQCGCAISLGIENPQIATVLCLAEGTVKNYISDLRGKLGRLSRHEIAALFEQALAAPPAQRI